MKHVRLIPADDVEVARLHEGLRSGRRTHGSVGDPVVVEWTWARERRSCRSCGFPLGAGERALTFRYCWPGDGDPWNDVVSAVAIHLSGCRHGAAHDLVKTGRPYRTRWAQLDEAEAAVFGMHAEGLSDARIASAVGTTSASVALMLRRVAKRLHVAGDRHARVLAAELLVDDPLNAPPTVEDQIDALIRDVGR